MNHVSRIAPVSDAQAARLVSPATLADLAEQITRSPIPGAAPGRPPRGPRRWPVAAAVASGLAAAVLIATIVTRPGARVGPVAVGPPGAQAATLSFVRHGGYIDVLVRNPVADPARYRREFARHHLDITLRLVPVSPSLVGTVVYFDEPASARAALTPITARGRCYTGGGGSICPVGIRIPADFRGQADLVFGRAARPGERYESTTSAFARGEALHGLRIVGRTVAAALRRISQRHLTAVFNAMTAGGRAKTMSKVPGRWYVYSADPWAPHKVLLFVGPTRAEPLPPPSAVGPTPSPSPRAPTPQPSTPSPSPSR